MDPTTLSWDFGDGRAPTTGGSVIRSFDQPGTHVVTFRARDKAGNESSVQKAITVEAPASGGTPPSGGGPLPAVQTAAIQVTVPKSVRIGKVKQLVLGAHAEQAGELTLRLVRGERVYSRLTVGLSPGDTKQRLRLPKGLKAGAYAVKIKFKPAGSSWSTASTKKVVFRKG
jgi:PKD repeat protein